MTDALPVLDYGEIFGHTLLTMLLFYGGLALWRRIAEALRKEALAARIAELRAERDAHG